MDNGNFRETHLAYHRIANYLRPETELSYYGDAYTIRYTKSKLYIEENKQKSSYELPQLMYVPAERNLIANIANAAKLKILSGSLVDFLSEYTNALSGLSQPLDLPINDTHLEYDKSTKTVYIAGRDYRVSLSESASGFQSLVPLYLVTQYLGASIKERKAGEAMSSEEKTRFGKMSADIMGNQNLTDEQKQIALSELGRKFNKTAFVNVIEEPEQNLFPTAQKQLLWQLLKVNNMVPANRLVMTTHSPYFINYLTLAVEAQTIKKAVTDETGLKRLNSIVPLESVVQPTDLALYELHDGNIQKLEPYEGLPSDENALNVNLGSSNDDFAKILELEQQFCK
jgi:hypothetical protein